MSPWALFERLRWDDGPDVCPHCAEPGRCVPLPAGRDAASGARLVWRCTACRQQFSALTGTVLEGTRTPLPVWIAGVRTLLRAAGPVSARAFAREHGITPETARHLIARLRAVGITPGSGAGGSAGGGAGGSAAEVGVDVGVEVEAALRQLLRLPAEAVLRIRAATPPRRGRPDPGPSADYR